MEVRFKQETDLTFIMAQQIEKRSKDTCFSPNDIASSLSIPKLEAIEKVQNLYYRGLATVVERDWDKPISGDERWCIINLSLTVGRRYEVLEIYGDEYLILNDPETIPYGNDPVVFHKSNFEIIDSTEPYFWECALDEDGERYCVVPAWNKKGFFDDYHDGVIEIRKQFWEDIKKYFPKTWLERKASLEMKSFIYH